MHIMVRKRTLVKFSDMYMGIYMLHVYTHALYLNVAHELPQ